MPAANKLKNWLKKKGETAEDWLPWAAVLLTVGLVTFVSLAQRVSEISENPRNPAGFVEVSDSEIPADSRDLKTSVHDRTRNTNSRQSGNRFSTAVRNGPSKIEIEKRTGVSGKRSRAVILSPTALTQRTPGKEMTLPLELFEDVQVLGVFKVVSGHEVNTGIHTGQITGDSNSKILLTVQDEQVAGFIRYLGKEYRIIADPESGLHYIIELSEPTGL
jgi:hypothetical protein